MIFIASCRLQRAIFLTQPTIKRQRLPLLRHYSQPSEKLPTRSASPDRPKEEVHEQAEALNVLGFTPPGGGGSGSGSSGGSFRFTGSPLADAALTTIVGLGMGSSSLVSR